MKDKNIKTLKIIVVVLALVLVAELIYFGVRSYNNRKNSVFSTVMNGIVMLSDDKYVGAGYSDYRHSDFNDYEKGYNKATISLVNDEKVVKEVGFKKGYNSYFNDVIKVSDGYVAVGSVEMTKEQFEEQTSEGLVIKYDKNFKLVWRKNISGIGKTEFVRVKATKSGDLVLVGTSVYASGYVGNHTTGGGILVRLDKDGKEKFRVNNAGPYNGRFNDVLLEDGGYVVVGLGKKNSGVIIKYDMKGKKLWSGSYGYTDKNGIVAVEKLGNNYVVATTKMVDPNKTSNYTGAIALFNAKGKKIDDVNYSVSDITIFNDLAVDKDKNIIATGSTGKLKDGSLSSDGFIVKFDKDLYEISSDVLKESNNDNYGKIYLEEDDLYVLGYSNSKLEKDVYKFNGYDYFPFIREYDLDLK